MLIACISCKETPFFTAENNLDPEARNYIPNHPENISYELNRDLNSVLIHWELSNGLGSILSGFKISTSYSDTLNYSSINYVSDFSRYGKYSYSDQFSPVIFNAIYKIESFYVRNSSDTVFSEPQYLTVPINQDYSIYPTLYPFIEEPFIRLYWYFEAFEGVSIELFKRTSGVFIVIGSHQITSSNGTVTLPITISNNEITDGYYYRLTSQNSSSQFLEIKSIPSPYYFLDVIQSSENDAMITVKALDSSQTFNSKLPLDSISFSLWEAEFSNPSFLVLDNQTPRQHSFSWSDSEFQINQIDNSLLYFIESSLKKKNISSDPSYFRFYYEQNTSSWVTDTIGHGDIPFRKSTY